LVAPSRSTVAAFTGVFAGAILIPRLAGVVSAAQVPALCVLVFVAMLLACQKEQATAGTSRAIMPPAFVAVFSALLLLGGLAAVFVAAAASLTPGVVRRRVAIRRALIDTGVAAVSVIAADLVWRLSTLPVDGDLALTSLVISTALAVLGYHLVQGAMISALVPLAMRRPIDRTWLQNPLNGLSMYLLGAAAAGMAAMVIEREMWSFTPVAVLVLLLGHRVYADYLRRIDEGHRRREVLDHLDHGMAVLDRGGRVILWNDALERLLRCKPSEALGRTLNGILPVLGHTQLPRAVTDSLADGQGRLVDQLRVSTGTDVRIFQVKVLPTSGGVSLLWHDVTERARAEHEIAQRGERLALAAEAANDGLWQWNLHTREFYVSGRWRAMIGLPAHAAIGGPGEWLDRVHPEDRTDLDAALEAHLVGATQVFQHEHRLRHEDGTYRRFLCRGLAVRGRGPKPDRIAGSLTDTTEQAIAQERLRNVGFQDPLTGLFNRAVFVEGLGRRLDECRRRGITRGFAVLYLDLDRFKIVNDSLGHMVGDELLVAASRRLEGCLRPGDALARLGGDEFAILLNGLNDDAQANAIAGRIQYALSTPFSIAGREVFTSASIGIAFGPADYANPDEIMRDADTAMYHAKSRGKARHEVFDADMHARVRDRLSLESDLRRAVAANDFEVHYQPIVALTSGMCVGFESLVRWNRNGFPVSPVTFVPIAEELGLIDSLGTWVIQEACKTFADWQRRYPGAGLDYITVNVSSRQLVQQNFPRVIQQTVRQTGIRPADLRVEITETALLDRPGEAAEVLRELRNFGVKVYLDDFGTGYSSLSHLHNLPVDALKIDRSFVSSLLLPSRPAIVESILALARTLNTSVVAEGIETDVQARELERLGCTHAQGFLFSKPLSQEHAEALVMASRPLGPKGQITESVVH
jgi:diguanylate cyclase (GGDEF)-like protein/PAS domain S-box-containing protein